MIDAVLGVDTNPLMGGVAAFNAQLAKRLGVPHLSWLKSSDCHAPLVSGKAWQWGNDEVFQMRRWPAFDVFWHVGWLPVATQQARRVFAANAELAEQIRPIRHDVITAHCPGLIVNRGAFPQSDITVFSFGHGHKLRVDLYTRLKELLDATGQTYTIFLSAGLHSGAAVRDEPFERLESLFGDHLIFLGILSDRAVAHYLATATYVVCFFEKGVRENNTTVNAALDAGAHVITNCDDLTPPHLRYRVWDVQQYECGCAPWAFVPERSRFTSPYTWDGLLEKLK